MTREHVFAHWLVIKVHGGGLVAAGASPAEGPPAAPVRIGGVVATVCAECNHGWMSTLEVGFRRLVFARPRAGVLPAPDRATLSRRFTKTAVLLAHAHGVVLVAAPHRSALVTGMPEDIEVFVGRQVRPRQSLDFVLDVTSDAEGRELAVRSVAIVVDDIVARVAARGTLTSRHGTRLWPLRTHTLRWETLPVITPAHLA